MKKLIFIIFCLSLSVQIGRAEKKEPEMPTIVCPHPHLVAQYLKHLEKDLHSFLRNEVKTEIEEVYIPEITLRVDPFVNAKGFLICAYHDIHKNADIPLLFVRMGKAHVPLEPIKRLPAEIEKQKK